MNMRGRAVLCGTALLLAAATPSVYADQCKDILVDGVRDVVQVADGRAVADATREWFCSQSFDSYISSRSSSTSLTVPLPDSALSFASGKSSQGSREARQEFCKSGDRQFSENAAISILKQVASKDIVAAWSRCMDSRFGGVPRFVSVSAEPLAGEYFRLRTRFMPGLLGQPEPIIDVVDVRGAKCPGERVRVGNPIPLQGIEELCVRESPTIPVVALIGTSYGDFSTVLEASREGQTAGTVTVIYSTKSESWIADDYIVERMQTGNHHCRKDCKGEPTRTNYKIRVDAGPNQRIVGQGTLRCVEGSACRSWHKIMSMTNYGSYAEASFDVWSHPTVWEYSVRVERRKVDVREHREGPRTVLYGRDFVISVPSQAERPSLLFSSDTGERIVALGAGVELAGVHLVHMDNNGAVTRYTLRVDP